MTTRIERPVARLVPAMRHPELVVTLTREGIWFREKGRRKKFLLTYGGGYLHAVRIAVEVEKREKIAARKAKRAAK